MTDDAMSMSMFVGQVPPAAACRKADALFPCRRAFGCNGIRRGIERPLSDGTLPRFPGLGFALVPGHKTVGTVVRVDASTERRVGETGVIPRSHSFRGVRCAFGGAGSRLIAWKAR